MATTLVRIQLLSKTSTDFATTNPVLLDGEMGIANVGSSVPVMKVGDGVRPWSALPDIVAAGAGADYVAGPVNPLPPGSPPTVVIDNGVSPPTISFGIPGGAQGDQGAIGPVGPVGPVGPMGAPNTLTIGTVTTGAPGSAADASITGTAPDQILNLTIPTGAQGPQGIQGIQGPAGADGIGAPANPTALVGLVAVNGTASTYTRSDGAPALNQAISPTWTGNHTFTGTVFNLEYLLPRLRFTETDAAAANKVWAISVNGEAFDMAVFDDSMSTKANFMVVNRTAQVIDSIDFASTVLRHNANAIPTVASSPTWTGNHTFSPAAGTAVIINAAVGSITGLRVNANATDDVEILINTPTAGNAYLRVTNVGGQNWSIGNQRSTGNFFISNAVGVGTPVMTITTAGVTTHTGQVRINASEALRLSHSNPYISFYDLAGSTRLGYLQGTVSGNMLLVSDAAAIQLCPAGVVKMTLATSGVLTLTNLVSAAGMSYASDTSKLYAFNPGLPYCGHYIQGAVNTFTGLCVYEGVLNPMFMSEGGLCGIYINGDAKWVISRLDAATARCDYTLQSTYFQTISTRKVKRETGTPTNAADILTRLRPILFRLLKDDKREQLGLIAEEVAEVCPQLSDGKTISYDRLAVLLLADWQESRRAA